MDKISIPVAVLVKVLEVLESNQFIWLPDGDEDNNYDVIRALDMLRAAMKDEGWEG